MNSIFKEYLFNKHILVSEGKSENAFEALYALAEEFSIKITEGKELANIEHIELASKMLGKYVPSSFYRGFPRSVRELAPNQLLFDQLYHYFCGNEHSIMEEMVDREIFHEDVTPKIFRILTEEKANEVLAQSIADLCGGTRPLSKSDYDVVLAYVILGNKISCGSKNLAVKLLVDTRDISFANYLVLSDVIKVLAQVQYDTYGSKNLKKLNLKNADRKFFAKLIDNVSAREVSYRGDIVDVENCYEKKKIWAGFLHHIHYKPCNEYAEDFVYAMRGKENYSAMSRFEEDMSKGRTTFAAFSLKSSKGNGTFLRNLDYILSRTTDDDYTERIMNMIPEENGIVLLQLLQHYVNYDFSGNAREFKFNRFNTLVKHTETEEEKSRRKSLLTKDVVDKLKTNIALSICRHYKDKLGKVYIAPEMSRIALPMSEANSFGGFGCLPKGTRVPVEKSKKIRLFTYWEKVDDIDLSCFGINKDGTQTEFSWRTMRNKQSKAITYSGDETNGYYGGSEYFDIDIEKFKAEYPDVEYIVMCDNVYSGSTFSSCVCRAGYMTREIEDSGEVYEQKTVKTSFTVNCDSRAAYLFAFDINKSELVWLNIAEDSYRNVAGTGTFGFIKPYFTATETINLAKFANICAREVVSSPSDADIIISDNEFVGCEDKEYVHSYDFEKVMAWMNM